MLFTCLSRDTNGFLHDKSVDVKWSVKSFNAHSMRLEFRSPWMCIEMLANRLQCEKAYVYILQLDLCFLPGLLSHSTSPSVCSTKSVFFSVLGEPGVLYKYRSTCVLWVFLQGLCDISLEMVVKQGDWEDRLVSSCSSSPTIWQGFVWLLAPPRPISRLPLGFFILLNWRLTCTLCSSTLWCSLWTLGTLGTESDLHVEGSSPSLLWSLGIAAGTVYQTSDLLVQFLLGLHH